MLLHKLCIGTVQFGIPYGINNRSGVPSDEMITRIFKKASENNINYVDTAHGYGNAESKTGEFSSEKFRIITKFSSVKHQEELLDELKVSLNRLKRDSLYGYMAHNAGILIDHPELWDSLIAVRKQGLVEKIGYSLYTPEQLEKLIELKCIPDIVQIPYSILDRKFEKYLPFLKEHDVEVHVRSVFLQGLYFMDPLNLPGKLVDLSDELAEIHRCCNEYNVSVGSLALNFPISNSLVDKVVIGVESIEQFEQNMDFIRSWKNDQNLLDKISRIEVSKKELLNPVNWNN